MRPTQARLLVMSRPRLNITSFPRPANPTSLQRVSPEYPPWTPLLPHPGGSTPSLPPRERYPIPEGWEQTSKVLKAAYPRSHDASTGDMVRESLPKKRASSREESKEDRVKRLMGEAYELIKTKYEATKQGISEDQKGLWIAGERWSRKEKTPGAESITLVVTHANGLHKESWYPTLKRFIQGPALLGPGTFGSPPLPVPPTASQDKKYEVDTIWFLDDIHHAASIDLNAGRIGPVHNWMDGGRDVVAVVEAEVEKGSVVVGVGHSFGGNALIHAAHARPDLFAGLFLVEPMLRAVNVPESLLTPDLEFWPLVQLAYKRRSHWPDIESAGATRTGPFFGPWHDEVWEQWLTHAIVPHPDGGVQLATPVWGEAAVFAEAEAIGAGWDKAAEVEVPVGFVVAGNTSALGGEDAVQEMVWRPPIASHEQFGGAGHLTVQERPDEVADALRRFLGNLFLPPAEKSKL